MQEIKTRGILKGTVSAKNFRSESMKTQRIVILN